MYLARVIEPVVTPVQHPFLDRKTLLLVRRIEPDGRETGPDRVAVDVAQAGAGDLVLVLEEGNSARQIFDDPQAPVRSVVVGCVDAVELHGAVVLSPGDAAAVAPRKRRKPREVDAVTPRYSESELRQQVCDVGRMMYERGFIGAADGNLAVRLDDQRLIVTPAGCLKGFMRPEELVVTDLDGTPLDSGRPSTEIQMHVAILRERPDAAAVVHAHPPYTVSFSLAGIPLNRCIIPEIVVTIGNVPTVPYATPGTRELPDSIRGPIKESDVLLLERHGIVTVADEIWNAFRLLDMVEHSAKIVHLAMQLGGAKVLDPQQVEKLMASRYDLGIESRNTIAEDLLARLACSQPLKKS